MCLKFKLIVVSVMLPILCTAANPSKSKLLSFKEWKKVQISDVQKRITQLEVEKQKLETSNVDTKTLKAQISAQKTESGLTISIGDDDVDSRLLSEIQSLDVVHNLTIMDYFVGYLSKMEDKENTFRQVAHKLTTEEVKELMLALSNYTSTTNSQSPEITKNIRSGNIPTTNVKSSQTLDSAETVGARQAFEN